MIFFEDEDWCSCKMIKIVKLWLFTLTILKILQPLIISFLKDEDDVRGRDCWTPAVMHSKIKIYCCTASLKVHGRGWIWLLISNDFSFFRKSSILRDLQKISFSLSTILFFTWELTPQRIVSVEVIGDEISSISPKSTHNSHLTFRHLREPTLCFKKTPIRVVFPLIAPLMVEAKACSKSGLHVARIIDGSFWLLTLAL